MSSRYKKHPERIRKRVNLTLDPDTYHKAQDQCYRDGVSVSEMVNRLLLEYIDDGKRDRLRNRFKR